MEASEPNGRGQVGQIGFRVAEGGVAIRRQAIGSACGDQVGRANYPMGLGRR